MQDNIKFNMFRNLAKLLNESLQIVPLLYGSLGLEILTGDSFNSDDVDILVPKRFIFEDWNILLALLESNGYKMVDLHEHTFEKDGYPFSFSYIENLIEYAQIPDKEIKTVEAIDCRYKLLSSEQYLTVYEKSVCDEYRKKKGKNSKDLNKVKYLKEKIK